MEHSFLLVNLNMNFLPGEFYHVYNRSVNNIKIFNSKENYLFFLGKIRKELVPFCDIIAYCLMPTHYHLLLRIKPESTDLSINFNMHPLSRKIGTLQSSYTQAINIETNRHGSLFQHKAKSKGLETYAFICFHYIHQNPLKAKLCKAIEEWDYSSFNDYYGRRNGTLPSKKIAYEYLDIPKDPIEFYNQSIKVISDEVVRYLKLDKSL